MIHRILGLFIALIIFVTPVFGKDITRLTPTKIADVQIQQKGQVPSLSRADICVARTDDSAAWFYEYPDGGGWLYGDELFRTYIDPSESCPSPYPYVITEVSMLLWYSGPSVDTIAADIAELDLTDPNCPFPGTVRASSSAWVFNVDSAGLYEMTIPLDEPDTVYGPFFAGMYFLDPWEEQTWLNVGPRIITDDIKPPSDTIQSDDRVQYPELFCTSYNYFFEDGGWIWVDLGDYLFGRLSLYVTGTTGGGGSNAAPQAELISHNQGQIVLGETTLWTRDSSGSELIDYAVFQYAPSSDTSVYTEISQDHEGYSPLRDGISNAGPGDGFSFRWDPTGLTEGLHNLRTILYDTLGRTSVHTVKSITFDPTPPTPTITSPTNGASVCDSFDLGITISDENMEYLLGFMKPASRSYSVGMETLNQARLGDTNDNTDDGNYAIDGEFGDYYNAPVAAALALKVWTDRGYTGLMKENVTPFGIEELAEKLAVHFKTRANFGSYDEDIFVGLKDYQASHGNSMNLNFERNPDYFSIRTTVEEQEEVAILGLNGTPSTWIAVDGFKQWQQEDGTFFITVSDPITGTIRDLPIRNIGGGCEVQLYSTWQHVDIMISIVANSWPVSRTVIPGDLDGSDGWQIPVATDTLVEDQLYFVRVVGTDATNYPNAAATVLYQYDCSLVYDVGDYNGDGLTDINDYIVLQGYITYKNIPPVGGAFRADTNGDNVINLADLVYYLRFLFGSGSAPAH